MSTWFNASLMGVNEDCTVSKVEAWVKQGLVKTCFTCVLEMILHLHQACNHLMLMHCSGIVNEELSTSSSSNLLGGLSQYIEDLNAELNDLLIRLHLEPDDENDKM
ncbi:hypothetical protein BKA83DRAFT_4129460 [Pisolithus microcarpus]|nr:hypothetical protein BKA83DRAFT_4129460 [Pisolithus microcarpus]